MTQSSAQPNITPEPNKPQASGPAVSPQTEAQKKADADKAAQNTASKS